MTPIALQRFALHLTIDQRTHDKLRYAQELLSHQVPSGDVAAVLDRALEALIRQLEKRKFASTTRPRGNGRPTSSPRHVPAHVKRAVWQRDGGQCTFVSESGKRCTSRALLEFDHVDEAARGGRATVGQIRLRCRAHNQYGAECSFGTEFMNNKRQEARHVAAAVRTKAAARARANEIEGVAVEVGVKADARPRARDGAEAVAHTKAKGRLQATPVAESAIQAGDHDVIPWLRQLGFRTDEARRAAKLCDAIPGASLEQRVRIALSYLHPRSSSMGRAPNAPAS